MTAPLRPEPGSPLDGLLREPHRYSFDAAVRLMMLAGRTADPAEAVRFRAARGLAFPAAEVLSVEPVRPDGAELAAPGPGGDDRPGPVAALTVALIGLTGPAGVLPRPFSAEVVRQLRLRSRAMPDFLDLLAHRLIAHYADAGAKYRPQRQAQTAALATVPGRDTVAAALLALTGHGTPHLVERLAAGREPLQHYAGLFAAHPRSAERLEALVSDWIGLPAEVVQFAGAWLHLPPGQRTRLAARHGTGQFARLGREATVGARAWDPQGRVVLRLGPMPLHAFAALLPDRPAHHRLVSLVRAFLGPEIGFALNPVLAADAVPPLVLGREAPPRLGWNAWLPSRARPRDADEACFEAEAPAEGRQA
ncbi:type VI secretion system baseplate subunit TssG [Paracraurococcus lichenis]|uniref:Type VI secretion system baseplate subunit TssG n=1 Tax=Paracraurococcus lichenis TaxID=3064888 RepID=A0ABT9E9Z0_9PROT|nr:type VI secretion system baseplate subunit TssG [Paracraurococcus sp. LOR1-02]MDO9712947.1 type VI secretion system baseplate subunit TssG [Paracraurococcus sp. LOR1-02]